MRFALLLFALMNATALGDDWTPPENPDPQAILDEAQADMRARRYKTALAKHVWFHENALEIKPSLYGVRLSFALSYWLELAERHPPALSKLKEIRDQARENVLAGRDAREAFHDMAAINRYLEEHKATAELFETLDEKAPKTAKEVFGLAQPSLIRGKAYSLIGKYVSPDRDFAQMRTMYREDKKLADDRRFGTEHREFADKNFSNGSATLVAILAVNDRKEEAEAIAASARAELDDASFHAALDAALKGVVPDPWP